MTFELRMRFWIRLRICRNLRKNKKVQYFICFLLFITVLFDNTIFLIGHKNVQVGSVNNWRHGSGSVSQDYDSADPPDPKEIYRSTALVNGITYFFFTFIDNIIHSPFAEFVCKFSPLSWRSVWRAVLWIPVRIRIRLKVMRIRILLRYVTLYSATPHSTHQAAPCCTYPRRTLI